MIHDSTKTFNTPRHRVKCNAHENHREYRPLCTLEEMTERFSRLSIIFEQREGGGGGKGNRRHVNEIIVGDEETGMFNLVEFHSASPLFSHMAFPTHIRISLYVYICTIYTVVEEQKRRFQPPSSSARTKYNPSQL